MSASSTSRTLLFDLDGTLTDNYAGISRSIRHALSALAAELPHDDLLRTCVGPPLRKTFARLLQTQDAARVEQALTLYRERYTDEGWRENEVYAGIVDALPALATRGHRMLVCTSKPRVYAQRIITHFGLDGWLDTVYGPELDGRFDNKDELLAEILATEKLDAGACVMIGDREQDMLAARANGVESIGVLWGFGTRDELAGAGAGSIIGHPSELEPTLRRQ
ncbi:MAG: HAD hydrolase-like protein [Betaproteobacteria bacterium]